MQYCESHSDLMARIARIEKRLDMVYLIAIGIAISIGIDILPLIGVIA